VIGAGLAGLACAHELRSVGCEVLVLEARNRLGGRVKSLANVLPGRVAEAGGEFFGTNHLTAQAYAAKFKLELVEAGQSESSQPEPIRLNGQLIREVAALEEEEKEAQRLLTEAARPIVAERPWESPNARSLDHTPTSVWLNRLDISALGKRLLETRLVLDNGVALNRQSLLGNLAQIHGGGLERFWSDTETHRCRGGNQQFASHLAEGIGLDRILLRCPASRIEVTERGAVVIDVCGKRRHADDVVLSAPPSTWRRIEFSPPLPPVLAPQMGSAVKFLLQVKNHFWERRGCPPSAISDDGAGLLWLGTETEVQGDSREVLVGFVGGPEATRWSRCGSQARIQRYIDLVNALQPGLLNALERIQFVDWNNEKWTAGGYSFPAPGQITAQGKLLSESLGRLHFAGEHTCYAFVGYMEGALKSGVTLAKRIVS
jgi:monoamine oxidase